MSAPPETIRNVMRTVSATDTEWYAVLKHRVRVDRSLLDEDGVSALDDDEPDGSDVMVVSVQRVVARLAADPAAMTSELRFGVAVLGTGLSCQFIYTLLLHTFFTRSHGLRDHVDVATLRRCLSAVQVALAVYVDKLVAFEQDVEPFMRFNDTVNAAFALRDADAGTEKAKFVEYVDGLIELAEATLDKRCGDWMTAVEETVRVVVVNGYDDEIFGGRSAVEDDRLVAMIRDVDKYEYVEFQSLGLDHWMSKLKITAAYEPDGAVDEADDD